MTELSGLSEGVLKLFFGHWVLFHSFSRMSRCCNRQQRTDFELYFRIFVTLLKIYNFFHLSSKICQKWAFCTKTGDSQRSVEIKLGTLSMVCSVFLKNRGRWRSGRQKKKKQDSVFLCSNRSQLFCLLLLDLEQIFNDQDDFYPSAIKS